MSEQRPADERPDGSESPTDDDGESPTAREQVAAPTEQFELTLGFGQVLSLVVAAAAVVGAAALLVDPSLLAPSDLAYLFVVATGVIAVLMGLQSLRGGDEEGAAVDLPLVEYRSSTSVPGEDIDAAVLGTDFEGAMGNYKQQREARDRLYRLVEATLERLGERAPEDDTDISETEWTDDPIARSLFELGSPFDRGDRLGFRFRKGSVFQRQVGAVVDAVADRLSVPDREWTDSRSRGDVGILETGWPGRTTDVTARDRSLDRWQAAVERSRDWATE